LEPRRKRQFDLAGVRILGFLFDLNGLAVDIELLVRAGEQVERDTAVQGAVVHLLGQFGNRTSEVAVAALPYSGSPHPNTADALGVLDEDPANTNHLIGIYSGYSTAKTNIGTASGDWNREHFWCQSYGTSTGPARTDLHHMRPEQANVNSSPGNNYYDDVQTGAPGYKSTTNIAAGAVWSRSSDTWEPPGSIKGDVARALLYMTVRYTGDATNEPRLTLTDNTNEIVSGATFMGRYTTLLRWHFADPVSAAEQERNESVFAFQANRNPFVDHPEWVATAFVPSLTAARTNNNLWMCWTNDYAPSMTVEQSRNLASGCLALTNTPVLTSTNTWAMTVPLQPGTRFFRLRLE
jgi:endonuclease I